MDLYRRARERRRICIRQEAKWITTSSWRLSALVAAAVRTHFCADCVERVHVREAGRKSELGEGWRQHCQGHTRPACYNALAPPEPAERGWFLDTQWANSVAEILFSNRVMQQDYCSKNVSCIVITDSITFLKHFTS